MDYCYIKIEKELKKRNFKGNRCMNNRGLKYDTGDKDILKWIKRKLIAYKLGFNITPQVIDIHPVANICNLKCAWCIGKSDSNTPVYMKWHDLEKVFNSIFEVGKEEFWPSEIHFCGCNSDPLLNKEVMKNAIQYLNERNVTIEIISNGVCLKDYISNNIEQLLLVDKISISLDVVNEQDFYSYKSLNSKICLKDIINSIEKICQNKYKTNSQLSIYTTFVATPETYSKEEWLQNFTELKNIGVNHVQVRNDYTNYDKNFYNKVKLDIEEIAIKLNAKEINYKESNSFDIKYNEYMPRNSEFEHCLGYRIWPTISADFLMYPCAHTANEYFVSLLDLKKTNYYDIYSLDDFSYYEKEPCKNCSKKCPSLIYYINQLKDIDVL